MKKSIASSFLRAFPGAEAKRSVMPRLASMRTASAFAPTSSRRWCSTTSATPTPPPPHAGEEAHPAAETSSDSPASVEAVEGQWVRGMANVYGPGNYHLFRPLYKELCDEMRREFYTKPPPPPPTVPTISGLSSSPSLSSSSSAATDAEQKGDGEPGNTAPPATHEDGRWSVHHDHESNHIIFTRAAVPSTRQGRVVAFATVELRDPPRMNAMLTFADWLPMEVLIEREGAVMHYALASNEGGMHVRNVRAYAPATAEELEALLDPTHNAWWERTHLYYDGPCLWHLELDMLNELYDVMQDHGIDLDWVRWAAAWIFYAEHVAQTRWSLGMLEELIPAAVGRGGEEDFVTERERALLDEPVEDWLAAHSM